MCVHGPPIRGNASQHVSGGLKHTAHVLSVAGPNFWMRSFSVSATYTKPPSYETVWGPLNWPLPVPSVPHCARYAPPGDSIWMRLFTASATYAVPAPMLMPSGDWNCPLPVPPVPHCEI